MINYSAIQQVIPPQVLPYNLLTNGNHCPLQKVRNKIR